MDITSARKQAIQRGLSADKADNLIRLFGDDRAASILSEWSQKRGAAKDFKQASLGIASPLDGLYVGYRAKVKSSRPSALARLYRKG